MMADRQKLIFSEPPGCLSIGCANARQHKKCSLKMVFARFGCFALLFAALLSQASPVLADNGRLLNVAFVDASADGIGKASFKALRTSGYENACWRQFSSIKGIGVAHIDDVPANVSHEVNASFTNKSFKSAGIRRALAEAQLDGVYIFISNDGTGYLRGVTARTAATHSPKPIPLSGQLIDQDLLSQRLCAASRAMDQFPAGNGRKD